jgi:hypothetical protein
MAAGGHAGEGFAASQAIFAQVVGWLDGEAAAGLTHAELEAQLDAAGRGLLCRLLQDHLDLRALREERIEGVADADGVAHGAVEVDHVRTLATIFGAVTHRRLAYRRKGHANLHPADAVLNLPGEKHSHGLRGLAAVEACRDSFDGAVAAITRATGQQLGKRQVEALARRAATDFAGFYADRDPPAADPADVLVLSADGKGIVMRPDALRAATAQAAAEEQQKLKTRLSKGEKRNRKRIATVVSVYDAACAPRTPRDVLARSDHDRDDGEPAPAPVAKSKWLDASVEADAAAVIADAFNEAERRDPAHARTWVALVDGNTHQIDRLTAEATQRGIDLAIVIDFVHVIEYVWAAAWCFFNEGDPAAETWVHRQLTDILDGHARKVAARIRRKANRAGLQASARTNVDTAAAYLRNKAPYLGYPTALARGWPVATGVIEGACRHLIKDRLDRTGARWSVEGAEAVLKLRAIISNGHWDQYWTYHLTQEHQRVHQSRYANNQISRAA